MFIPIFFFQINNRFLFLLTSMYTMWLDYESFMMLHTCFCTSFAIDDVKDIFLTYTNNKIKKKKNTQKIS